MWVYRLTNSYPDTTITTMIQNNEVVGQLADELIRDRKTEDKMMKYMVKTEEKMEEIIEMMKQEGMVEIHQEEIETGTVLFRQLRLYQLLQPQEGLDGQGHAHDQKTETSVKIDQDQGQDHVTRRNQDRDRGQEINQRTKANQNHGQDLAQIQEKNQGHDLDLVRGRDQDENPDLDQGQGQDINLGHASNPAAAIAEVDLQSVGVVIHIGRYHERDIDHTLTALSRQVAAGLGLIEDVLSHDHGMVGVTMTMITM